MLLEIVKKSIVIGHEGSNLKRIGQQTRIELEKMIHKKVLLKTFVKVNKNWNNDAQYLSSLELAATKMPINWEPCFLLHARSFGDTSIIADVFTESSGKVSIMAKGAKTPIKVF